MAKTLARVREARLLDAASGMQVSIQYFHQIADGNIIEGSVDKVFGKLPDTLTDSIALNQIKQVVVGAMLEFHNITITQNSVVII